MHDQSHFWSKAAQGYESEFIDPFRRTEDNPLFEALSARSADETKVVADLGCGIGPLLPHLSRHFAVVHAIDFAPGMIERARERCSGLRNVEFHQRPLTDLEPLAGRIDVAVAVNSLVQPTVSEIEAILDQVHRILKPGGVFLGVVPAMDSVHYHTMLLLDRARRSGMPEDMARQNAEKLGEHHLYDFAFGGFRYVGLQQHFWQPFEVDYRLKRAGFRQVVKKKFRLEWDQFAAAGDLRTLPSPWDWFFQARRGRK